MTLRTFGSKNYRHDQAILMPEKRNFQIFVRRNDFQYFPSKGGLETSRWIVDESTPSAMANQRPGISSDLETKRGKVLSIEFNLECIGFVQPVRSGFDDFLSFCLVQGRSFGLSLLQSPNPPTKTREGANASPQSRPLRAQSTRGNNREITEAVYRNEGHHEKDQASKQIPTIRSHIYSAYCRRVDWFQVCIQCYFTVAWSFVQWCARSLYMAVKSECIRRSMDGRTSLKFMGNLSMGKMAGYKGSRMLGEPT